jgi:hypothetical protein
VRIPLLAAVAISAAACVTGTAPPGPVVTEHQSIERGAATAASVAIDMSAGELELKSGAKTLFEGDFDFNVPDLKPSVVYTVAGATGALKVSQGSASGNYVNLWRVSLDETTPIDLDVRLGAGDSQLVLGRINLRSLAVRLGAGDVVIDLRGMPSKGYGAKVQTGAGDTTIRLPAAVGISARTSGLIGDSNVSGLEKRDGRWVNPRADGSPVTIELDVQHAIGDLRIEAE